MDENQYEIDDEEEELRRFEEENFVRLDQKRVNPETKRVCVVSAPILPSIPHDILPIKSQNSLS